MKLPCFCVIFDLGYQCLIDSLRTIIIMISSETVKAVVENLSKLGMRQDKVP